MDKNAFGGSVHGLYVPLTDLEQEALDRLKAAGELQIVVVGWGIVHTPRWSFGDKRVQFHFTICFQEPIVPRPVYLLDFEVQTQAGQPLFRTQQPTTYNEKPIMLGAGLAYAFVLDLALRGMNPAFVKQVVPGARGLTTRQGNMHLTTDKQRLLHQLELGERRIREMDEARLEELKKK